MLAVQLCQYEIPTYNPNAYLFIYDGKCNCYRNLNMHIYRQHWPILSLKCNQTYNDS